MAVVGVKHCRNKGPRNRIIVKTRGITVACTRPVHRRPSISQIVACAGETKVMTKTLKNRFFMVDGCSLKHNHYKQSSILKYIECVYEYYKFKFN
ncbi:hypothetical protein PUN28_010523 [Cardiocondyla obscurior]|uniref:Uncharacterized protein n=1 Tax=Cardiocondyla obscurior TaxID=286306 RepID=A0AAW2FIP8_9HYME